MFYSIKLYDKSHRIILVEVVILLSKPKNNIMKYNVTKSDVTDRKKVLKFIGQGLTENEAVNILFETHGTECCKLFQDVTDIVTDNDNMIYFEVTNNKRIFRYEIEVSQLEMFAVMFKDVLYKN